MYATRTTAPALPALANEPCPSCPTTATFGDVVVGRVHSAASVRDGAPHFVYHSILTCPSGHQHRRFVARWFDTDDAPEMYEQGELRGGRTNSWGMTLRSRTAVRREAARPVSRETCVWDECPRWVPGGGLCSTHERALGL